MPDEADQLYQRIHALEQEVASLKRASQRGVRKRSETRILGMPLYDIAIGPDPAKNEKRGHARGFLAVGDIATGIVALGGIAIGLISVGGCAIGVVAALGGCALGSLALGGLAVGGVAFGGAAIGLVAVGGGALGYYAMGGGAYGKFVLSGAQQDAEAIRFFGEWIPAIKELAGPKG